MLAKDWIIEFWKRQSKVAVIIAAIFLLVGLGYIDYVTGPDLSLLIFYFIPTLLTAWVVGPWSGTVMAVASSGVWLLADAYSRDRYSHWLVPYWNFGTHALIFITVTYLFGKLKTAHDRETQSARTDPLTQIANRRAFVEACEAELQRSKRFGCLLSVAIVDIDNFKKINDAWGHETGDALLLLTATLLASHARAIDMVARLGGDEFAILLPQINLLQAKAVLEKIRHLLIAAVREKGYAVTFSAGSVTFRTPPDSVSDMLRRADRMMYLVKRTGKNATAAVEIQDTISAAI